MNPQSVLFTAMLLLAIAHPVTVLSDDPVRLYGATDNRAPVIHSAYAYYPDQAELRIRLTLSNRQVKSARYRNPDVIKHLLALLSSNQNKTLFCVYDGNAILSIYAEQLFGR